MKWCKKRKRAILLGDMGYTGLWCDPETGEVWQANSRWALFPCESHSTIEEAIEMLKDVHMCELLIDKEKEKQLRG